MVWFRKHPVLIGAAAAAVLLASSSAFPAGFEKSTLWSGRYAAVGGAATSIVDDAQALYFNPAGLSRAKGLELSGNFSPTDSQFQGPIATSSQVGGNHLWLPIFGAFVSDQVTDKLGIGAGAYVSGGTQSKYEDVDFTPLSANYTSKGTLQGNLSIIEYSLGAGYELLPGLSLGLGYRIVHVGAHLQSATNSPLVPPSGALVSANLDQISATRYNGWRVGVQYHRSQSHWGLGAVWRTEVSFIAKGIGSGQLQSAATGTVTPLASANVELTNTFPMELSFGGFYDLGATGRHRLLIEYTFAQYAKDRAVGLNGTIGSSPFLIALPDIPQNWHNLQNLRFGYDGMLNDAWALRAGYVLTSQVTPNAQARPTFPAPGMGHTFTLGTGRMFLGGALETDLALEYSFDQGTGTNEFAQTGDFGAQALVAHLGATYRF